MNRLFDGIPDLLEDLQRAGVRLAVATSKAQPTAQRILTHFGMDGYFEVIAGAELGRHPRRQGRGDRLRAGAAGPVAGAGTDGRRPLHDVEGASFHGIDTVVVDWGYGGADFDGPTPWRRCTGWRRWRNCEGCSVSKPAGWSAATGEQALHALTFVCSGNICRSPMAEKMLAHQIPGAAAWPSAFRDQSCTGAGMATT